MGSVQRPRWVEVGFTVLRPEERPFNLPPETRAVPYYARVRGFLEETCVVGDMVEIETLAGRKVEGKLLHIDPPFTHDFGRTVQELVQAGREADHLLWSESDVLASGENRP